MPKGSIDRIWSWDVFVHIQTRDVESYLRQFASILAPGGRGVIHHSKHGTNTRGWRSEMTAGVMAELCTKHGLRVVEQFDSWDNNQVRIWPSLTAENQPDIVTIFELPRQ